MDVERDEEWFALGEFLWGDCYSFIFCFGRRSWYYGLFFRPLRDWLLFQWNKVIYNRSTSNEAVGLIGVTEGMDLKRTVSRKKDILIRYRFKIVQDFKRRISVLCAWSLYELGEDMYDIINIRLNGFNIGE